MKSRKYYERLFQTYPDVVNTDTFCKMLGIGISLALRIIKGKHIQYIHYMEQSYIIPKVWVIDYVMGEHYAALRNNLKKQI